MPLTEMSDYVIAVWNLSLKSYFTLSGDESALLSLKLREKMVNTVNMLMTKLTRLTCLSEFNYRGNDKGSNIP